MENSSIMKKLLAIAIFTLVGCSGDEANHSKSFDLDVKVIEFIDYKTELNVRKDCEFKGYKKDETESVFTARCGNALTNYIVKNADLDINSFTIKSNVNMEVPLELTGGTYGIDLGKLQSHDWKESFGQFTVSENKDGVLEIKPESSN